MKIKTKTKTYEPCLKLVIKKKKKKYTLIFKIKKKKKKYKPFLKLVKKKKKNPFCFMFSMYIDSLCTYIVCLTEKNIQKHRK